MNDTTQAGEVGLAAVADALARPAAPPPLSPPLSPPFTIIKHPTELLCAFPHAHADIVDGIMRNMSVAFSKYKLTNRNRVLAFLSTAGEESGGFTVLSENLNYSAARAHQVFPALFPTIASAEPFQYQPEKFANKVYDGRMGNRPGSDDGWKYRGQGLIQITGAQNFAMLAELTQLDLINNPAMAASVDYALDCSLALFARYPFIMNYADEGRFYAVWALVGSGRPTGPVINFAAHEASLNALAKAIPK